MIYNEWTLNVSWIFRNALANRATAVLFLEELVPIASFEFVAYPKSHSALRATPFSVRLQPIPLFDVWILIKPLAVVRRCLTPVGSAPRTVVCVDMRGPSHRLLPVVRLHTANDVVLLTSRFLLVDADVNDHKVILVPIQQVIRVLACEAVTRRARLQQPAVN